MLVLKVFTRVYITKRITKQHILHKLTTMSHNHVHNNLIQLYRLQYRNKKKCHVYYAEWYTLDNKLVKWSKFRYYKISDVFDSCYYDDFSNCYIRKKATPNYRKVWENISHIY